MAKKPNKRSKVIKSEPKTPKVIFTVILANGGEISHTYDVPSDYHEAEEFISNKVKQIANAMTRGKDMFLWFENPTTFYNPDNVSGIRLDTVEAERLAEIIRKSQEQLGFIKRNK